MSQESSVPKSLGAKDSLKELKSLTAQTRRGWIPVTSTGMREYGVAAAIIVTGPLYYFLIEAFQK
ncbi:hypothetical protein F4V91_18870 [Neorhizobium galegae]|uniref:Uncharacterized protein n=1 Tax=Neorhizobium galegae TaxID=399 RepID=A0A6A1TTV7_NEOGA|nr:hypothetical protein F4V91_18870 [Neorhizobium galegae]